VRGGAGSRAVVCRPSAAVVELVSRVRADLEAGDRRQRPPRLHQSGDRRRRDRRSPALHAGAARAQVRDRLGHRLTARPPVEQRRELEPGSASAPSTPANCSSLPAGTSSRPEHRAAQGQSRVSRICAAAPIPASSGRKTRHRLDHGGDRDANRVLYMIAVCRLRYLGPHARLRRTPHQRRTQQEGDHPLSQALHRPRDLSQPPHQARSPHKHLPSTETSQGASRYLLRRPRKDSP
jgi:hypothetical protein